MTTTLSPRRRRAYGAIALAVLLAATIAGCAQAPGLPGGGSGSSAPNQINYHGFPYDIQAG